MLLVAATGASAAAIALQPAPAAASPLGTVCTVAGLISGIAGKACKLVQNSGHVLSAGKKLLSGHIGSAAKEIFGGGSSSSGTTAVGLTAVVAWAIAGAKFTLHETAKLLSQTTSPQLRSTWFSSAYWRIAGIASLLTLPFLFAAAVQALLRSDMALLMRAALGYLPLAMLAVGIAAPLTMLLLAVSDQLSGIVSAAAGNASSTFLAKAGGFAGVLTLLGSPFVAFVLGVLTVAATLVLWIELLMRAAAVYVIVLMLPLAFAAFVWPARRIWALRAVELLVALILSKFAIVAVLSLGGAALASSVDHASVVGALAGSVIVLMGALAPWALLRLLPMTELASGAAGALRADGSGAGATLQRAWSIGKAAEDRAASLASEMRLEFDAETPEPGAPEAQSPRATDSDQEDGGKLPLDGLERKGTELEVSTANPDASSGATAGSSEGSSEGDSEGDGANERLPGLAPMYQAPNGSWNPLILGPTDGPQRLWPPDEEQRGRDEDRASSPPGAPARDQSRDGPGEDHDPTPPPQPAAAEDA